MRAIAGRHAYLNDAYLGVKRLGAGGSVGLRVGNQILHWSESPFFGHSIAPVYPISLSRRYQPVNTAGDLKPAR